MEDTPHKKGKIATSPKEQLLAGQSISAPGMFDLSARVAKAAGARRHYTTGYWVSASLPGKPDASPVS